MPELLPEKILWLQDYGLEIRFCENLRSYKKLIPALREFPDDIIITADDDWYYCRDWLAGLCRAYEKNPEWIHCYAADIVRLAAQNRIMAWKDWIRMWGEAAFGIAEGYLSFCANNGAGTLYPPHYLHPDVCRDDVFCKLVPADDDLWFWVMAIRSEHKMHIVPAKNFPVLNILIRTRQGNLVPLNEFGSTLWNFNKPEAGGQCDIQLARLVQAYPEILPLLAREQNMH